MTAVAPAPPGARALDLCGPLPTGTTVLEASAGTGKTHTIANIVSHYMAMGKRTLVTARTPEAIAAVREKLPENLRPLVISSVGSDREGALGAARHRLNVSTTGRPAFGSREVPRARRVGVSLAVTAEQISRHACAAAVRWA